MPRQRGVKRASHVQLEIPAPDFLPEQPDDDGALTQARFRFQAEVGARWFLKGLVDGQVVSVGCELLEDLVLHTIRGVALVSVKHREPTRGAWTLDALCADGGLAHLFDRWLHCTDRMADVESIHVSNGALKTGAKQAQQLSEVSGSPAVADDAVLVFARLLTSRFLALRAKSDTNLERIPDRPPPARPEDLAADDVTVRLCSDFIRSLSFINVPHREQIGAISIVELVLPYLERHGMDGHRASACYEALVDKIDKANRTFGERKIDLILNTVGTGAGLADAQRRSQQAARTITIDAARASLHQGGASPLFPVDREPLDAPGGADLARKMRAGGLSHTQQRYAERARSAWYTTWSAHRLDLPGDAAALQGIELQVIDQVVDAQRDASRLDVPYGQALFDQLRTTVSIAQFIERPQLRMNDLHALGVAFDLCDACDFDFQQERSPSDTDGAP